MHIQVIVSTFKNAIENIDASVLDYENLSVINQNPVNYDNSVKKQQYEHVEWLDFDQKGLSRSRNLGVSIAKQDYIYLTDDDLILKQNFKEIISRVVEKNKNVDIFAFQVNGIEKEYKKYSDYLTSMKLSSVQLVLKTEFVKENQLFYDERFGAGSEYGMGEENIFLFDALRKGAKIKYFPIEIAKVYVGDSSWFKGFDRNYFVNRGAIFYRMFGLTSDIFSLIFCIRKRKLYKDKFDIKTAFKFTREGKKEFKLKNKN